MKLMHRSWCVLGQFLEDMTNISCLRPADCSACIIVHKLSAVLVADMVLPTALTLIEIAKDMLEGAEPGPQIKIHLPDNIDKIAA